MQATRVRRIDRGSRLHLRMFLRPSREPASRTHWLVNGFRAVVLLWTAEEWSALSDRERPSDAQVYPDGSWVSLRME